jgi:hypothetical protein
MTRLLVTQIACLAVLMVTVTLSLKSSQPNCPRFCEL